MVRAFQVGQNVNRRRSHNWAAYQTTDDDHVEKVLAVVRENLKK
jgi:hypothetical protein